MAKKNKTCCVTDDKNMSYCKVEAVVSVDLRGQMILPKDIREKANIKAGDKLTVIGMEKGGKVCCLSLVKTDDFADMVKGFLGPMMSGIMED